MGRLVVHRSGQKQHASVGDELRAESVGFFDASDAHESDRARIWAHPRKAIGVAGHERIDQREVCENDGAAAIGEDAAVTKCDGAEKLARRA